MLAATPVHAQDRRTLDDFRDLSLWSAVASDGVSAKIRRVDGPSGKALCLDYDFRGRSGYAVAKRTLLLHYPANYAFDLQWRGKGPANNIEFKFGDATGDNVWWSRKPSVELPSAWAPLRIRKRQIDFAWGPGSDRTLKESASLELTVSAAKGGAGEACIADLGFRELPPVGAPGPISANADTSMGDGVASYAVDRDPQTAWRAPSGKHVLQLDFGASREFGGLRLQWQPGLHATDYAVDLSEDGRQWLAAREVHGGDGGVDLLFLPESEARYLRLRVLRSATAKGYALADVALQPLATGENRTAFLAAMAKEDRRGLWPRGFSGEQPYWTLLGISGGHQHGLMSEDGAVELARGDASIEPFVLDGGKLVTWADVKTTQSLQDGALPIPSVRWTHPHWTLDITSFGDGKPGASRLITRYRLRNSTTKPQKLALTLAVRPMQVNPPRQFLSTPGGHAPIHALSLHDRQIELDGKPRVELSRVPDNAFAGNFDGGEVVQRLERGEGSGAHSTKDADGLASGAVIYRMTLKSGETREIDWAAQLDRGSASLAAGEAAHAQLRMTARWRDMLGRVRIDAPAEGRHLTDSVKTALAWMLISRDGPRLQPGTRSYARSWIRDGAMISDVLLAFGHNDAVTDYLRWYAPYQFDNGKVPCCVDERGSDPVPENDSHGELIHAVAQHYRHTRNWKLLESMWPHVRAAVAYMDELRRENDAKEDAIANPALRGLMPASISHEGYSAKPVHSYWDDAWALRGYRDAADIAGWLGDAEEKSRYAQAGDNFERAFLASIRLAAEQHKIDFIPGSAELGDFDATSTSVLLTFAGLQDKLPQPLLDNTFRKYWSRFEQRRDGRLEWKDYTPYELRVVGTFVRLGWRERANDAMRWFLTQQQPPQWNQWAEVVSRTARVPFFVGDLPHAWVESEAARSAVEMFAYDNDAAAMVIAAGIPPSWLQGRGVGIHGLHTPWGTLGYTFALRGDRLSLAFDGDAKPPHGFLLPWPFKDRKPGTTRIHGRTAQWQNGTLAIPANARKVEIEIAQ
ncbi:MAG: discoidin domain-containing protein [Proteobacteria bacterium]|nr:discoidin domain-containing protein [Pseudomonadota bacterium]